MTRGFPYWNQIRQNLLVHPVPLIKSVIRDFSGSIHGRFLRRIIIWKIPGKCQQDEGKATDCKANVEMTFWLGNVRRNIQRQANAIR